MFVEREDAFYYITLMNENYRHPPLPENAEENILRGLHRVRISPLKKPKARTQLIGGGTILRESLAAAELLENDFGVAADVWSATSFNLLARDGRECARYNMLHPGEKPRMNFVAQQFASAKAKGPAIAATDYIKLYAEQIRPFVSGRYATLGTDGFGRSDTRENLRRHFEVDRGVIVLAALSILAEEGEMDSKFAREAIKKYNINADREDPLLL